MNGYIQFTISGESGTRTERYGQLPVNTWTHVYLVYDGIDMTGYYNGIKQNVAWSTGSTGGPILDSPENLWIGQRLVPTYRYFNGLIDDVRIYNYARTQKQILEDMEGGMLGAARMPQPIAHWRFDEGHGETVNNSGFGGSDLIGTLGTGDSAPSWSNEGKASKALEFEGSQRITLANPSVYQIDNKTVSFWAKPSGDIDNYQLPFYGGANWYAGFKPTNQMMVSYKKGDGSQQTAYTTEANTVIPDEWHYYAYGFNVSGDNVTISFYRDSQFISSSTRTTGYSSSYDSTFYLGGVATVYYDGLLDEVKFYNYALSEDEVALDYNQGMAAVMGQSSSNTGSTAPGGSAAQEYCVPGSTDTCRPPVAEWLFEENTGDTAYDTSGNGNDGTLQSMDNSNWVVGANSSGAGLSFDGEEEYISVAHSSLLEPSSITISAWIKIPSEYNPTNGGNIVDKGANSGYRLRIKNNENNREIDFLDRGATNWLLSDFSVPADQWTHIVATGDSSGLKIYANGELKKSNSTAYGGPTPGGILKIGDDNGVSDTPFDGLIDNVRIYDYARTPAQIAWDYNRGGPVGHWRFDECQGTTAYDVSGNENHGTINIGSSAPQTTAGTCTDGSDASAWYNGREGKINSAMSFDGEDDYVSLTTTGTINPPTGSVSVWVKPDGNQGSPAYVFAHPKTSDNSRVYIDFASGGLSVDCRLGNPTTIGNQTLTNDTWNHIVCGWDDTSAFFYINGINKTTTSTFNGLTSVATTSYLGSFSPSTQTFDGLIDDVRIYNYALTEEQIKTLYNNGAVRFGD